MPNVIVISGANGAGKSTLAPYLLRDTFGILEYVNADTIAEGLSAFAPETAAFDAGKTMLKRLDELAEKSKNFAFETTLASRSYAKRIADLKSANYRFHLFYLWLNNENLAIERVRERVKIGGHNIPEKVIRRRYKRGLVNLFDLYLPLANSWQIYDASAIIPQNIASGDTITGQTVFNEVIWKKIRK